MTQKSPNSISLQELTRCQHRTRTGRRCQNQVSDRTLGLCPRHAHPLQPRREESDLAVALAGQLKEIDSASDIKLVLSNLLFLLSQDRISARRAAVIAYISNLLLRALTAVERELNPASDPPIRVDVEFPDLPRRDRSGSPTQNAAQFSASAQVDLHANSEKGE